jgi:hypothetical protein
MHLEKKVYGITQKRPRLCPYCGARLQDGLAAIGGKGKTSRNYWFHIVKSDGKVICPRRLAIEDFFRARKNNNAPGASPALNRAT